jgi:hypothetical protein
MLTLYFKCKTCWRKWREYGDQERCSECPACGAYSWPYKFRTSYDGH